MSDAARQALTLERLEQLAHTPVLLVASDYDGTLAEIVEDPADARPQREAIVALRMLAALAHTHVAVISGRALRDLAELAALPPDVHLVGSHGSEFDLDFQGMLSPELTETRARLLAEIEDIARTGPGFLVEEKPASVALHYRLAADDVAQRALERVERGPATREGIFTRNGKKVVELSVVRTSKGMALDSVRRRVGATCIAFIGDDLTDEEAFASLTGSDVGVKVGDGESLARYRVRDPHEVAQLLARLAELRAAWIAGAGAVPIERHAMLSDQRTVALVTPDARITWLCLPRIDSPALFAELLGGPVAGRFAIEPVEYATPLDQSYLPESMVLRTRWRDLSVTDFLDCTHDRPRQRAGRSDLLRLIEGRGRVRIEFAPRLDFGRTATRLRKHEAGIVVEGAPDPIVLRAPGVSFSLRDEGAHQVATAEVEMDGTPVLLDLRYGTASLNDVRSAPLQRRDATHEYWASWSRRLELPSVEPRLVLRSALTLKALCYAPSGAIAAAATTSLPEHVGGCRNWDYRYSWIRDGALSATALVKLGSTWEALQFLDWVLHVVEGLSTPASLRPLYGVDGESVPSDSEISELSGYRASRPVRVGNSAATQIQLDVFGPVVDLVHELLLREAPLSARHWRLVEAMVSAVAERWADPDHGIWEVRQAPRHHVHSRVMCWLTLDRAVRIARSFMEADKPEWSALRDAIANDVVEHGWNPDVTAFTSAYGSSAIDASALHVGLSGLVPADDRRFVATVEAVESTLLDGPGVYRYRFEDGLPGREGAFLLCTCWLVDSYLAIGRNGDARRLFRELVALVGPTGLLAEEYDIASSTALGNFPQAYSHIGLIESALKLSAVEE
jgi:trehalose 6-phosphate phosphatase